MEKEILELLNKNLKHVNYTNSSYELMNKNGLDGVAKELNDLFALLGVGKSVKEKNTPTFEEWIKTFKQVDGKLYQLDNYRTYCIAAMHQEYRLTFNVEP